MDVLDEPEVFERHRASYCTLRVVECAVHPEAQSIATCAVCDKALCAKCAAYDVDGGTCCDACGRAEDDRGRALGSALLFFVGFGYLASLAVSYLVFKAQPFVGGIAAIAAIAVGRALQLWLRPPAVTRRT
jgi:hypothetical protein